MIRYLIVAVLSCLYVAGSIWIVSSQGHAYRDGLGRMKPVASAIENSAPALAKVKATPVPPIAASQTAIPRLEAGAFQPAPAKAANPAADRSLDHLSPAPPVTEVARAVPVPLPPSKNSSVRPRGNTAPASPLANNAFWKQPQLTRVWDVAHLKPDDECRLRDELHKLIVYFNPLVDDPSPWLSRVEEATEPFLKTLHRKDINYKVFILNSDVVNAFSIPGGYIYISRALFDLIGEDEDYVLQFAIGHEIAHVDLEHAIKCLRDPGVMKMTEGTLTKLFTLILPFGYLTTNTGDQEFEADEWAATRMQRFGHSRRELVFLQKLEGYSKKNGFYEGRIQPRPGRDLSPLENHYRAQTPARKRLKHLKEIMDRGATAPK